MKTIVCQNCGVDTPKRGPGLQKYCEPCSEERDLERKKLWAQKHPQKRDSDVLRGQYAESRSRIIDAGADRNAKHKQNIAWMADCNPDLEWCIRISVPFSYSLSKNSIFTNTRHGHIALRREARANRDAITQLLREKVRDIKIANSKLWVDILVQKPNHRGDALNVVDLVADAIKDAVGVDDRWFSIRRLDWQIVKNDPQLFIGIGQEECVDSIVCSHCGLILPLSAFTKNKSAKVGVTRACKECRAAARKRRDEQNPRTDITVRTL